MGRTGTGDREIMRLVAELYYERDLRQPEVAAMTGYSISKVSRLLSAARDRGVVRISVEAAPEGRPAVATQLERLFGVEVRITPGQERDPAAAARLCGVAAADSVVEWLPASGTLGVAAGYTVAAMASALPRMKRHGLTIVPVVGGWDTEDPFLDGNLLARRMAERLEAQARPLHAPAVLESEAMRDALLRDASVAATTSLWASLDLVVLGIGGRPDAHPGYRTVVDRLGEASRHELQDLGAVGDLAGHFFRADGSFAEAWNTRTLTIPVASLRAAGRVVGVAAGTTKVAPIVGALRTGVLHALVTDRLTAEAVLSVAS